MTPASATFYPQRKFIRRILAVAAALITVSVGALGVWIHFWTADALQGEIREEVRAAGTSAADGIQKWLDGRLLLVRALGDDLAAAQTADFTALVSRPVYKANFSEAYFGAEADGAFYSFNPTPLPEGYDPRKRPWYQAAVAAKGMALTEPYVDATTKNLVIGVAFPVTTDGKLRGVVGGDLALDALQTFLKSIDLAGKGYVFLVDAQGKTLVHIDDEKVMKPSGFVPATANADDFSAGGAEIVQFYKIEGLPSVSWYVGVALDRAKVTAPLRQLSVVLTVTIVVTILIIVPLLGLVIVRIVARPITDMTRAMTALSDGDLSVAVPALGRRDEIGAMANALEVFKDSLTRNKAMEAEVRQSRERVEAEKRAALKRMADAFEASVKGIVGDVTKAASQMKGNAEALTAIATDGRDRAAAVASAAAQTSANVQTVAVSAEEMTSSVAEISRQVNHSNEVARQAVDRSEVSSRSVQALAEQAKTIGTVVELINSIASQTNLLALNATIEAARAGEAGKGFAVVASEVKNLATQTAKATEEISAQIAGMQDAASGAVVSINEIAAVIAQISEYSTTIAAAVEEQDAATREIARNVQQAALGTQHISSNIAGVQEIADGTGDSAHQVLGAAHTLAEDADRLSVEVDRFIREVRAG
jgi:methyl-accepting chemotaxis protein